jgi:hypothetical protein
MRISGRFARAVKVTMVPRHLFSLDRRDNDD